LEGGGDADVVGDGVVVEGFVVGLGAGEEAEGVFEDEGLADGESGLGSGFEEVGEGEACGPADGIDVAGEVEGVAEAAKDADAFAEGELEVDEVEVEPGGGGPVESSSSSKGVVGEEELVVDQAVGGLALEFGGGGELLYARVCVWW
jgi:hypothetical protein